MAFWDFLKKLVQPETPTPTPPASPAPTDSVSAETPAPVPPEPESLGMSLLPITRDELLKQGADAKRNTNWITFAWQDQIPPTSDARTMLIDRGMLTQGILTAEELAEMHRVGDQYREFADRFKSISIKAGQNAEQAVEADRAARAAIKAQKKVEAAARKLKRAEEVAHRRATDIIFVGRSVSALMNDRQSDAEKLTAAGLPMLSSPADLATALNLTISQLRWLCYHTDVTTRMHYIQFEVPKKSGGTRTLSAPHQKLAAAQEWILTNILNPLPTEDAAHGFVMGRSTLTNARPHAGKDVVVNVDLENFFPTIRFGRVRAMFRRLGYSGSVATLLALLCTECPRKKVVYDQQVYYVAMGPRGLPQGACTSPAISNQIARRLDRRLSSLMKKLEWTYTRYADDLTFSTVTGQREKVGYLLARVRHIADDEGFQLNPKKTRVQRPETRQSVTGLVVNVQPSIPRDTLRQLRAILHRAKTEGLAAQNRIDHPNFRGWVEGMIAYVSMVKPTQGEAMRQQLEQLG